MRIKFYILASLLLFVTIAYSQKESGSIQGTVLAAYKKAPLQEAVVTLTSPVLEGSKIALTDSVGGYRFGNLPPGKYTISFEMEGYRTASRNDIPMTKGMGFEVSIEMARENGGQAKKSKEKITFVSDKKS